MKIEFLMPNPEVCTRDQGINAPNLDIVQDALLLVGGKLATTDLTPLERVITYDYAMREHLAAADNPIRRRPRPSFVIEMSYEERNAPFDELAARVNPTTPKGDSTP